MVEHGEAQKMEVSIVQMTFMSETKICPFSLSTIFLFYFVSFLHLISTLTA